MRMAEHRTARCDDEDAEDTPQVCRAGVRQRTREGNSSSDECQASAQVGEIRALGREARPVVRFALLCHATVRARYGRCTTGGPARMTMTGEAS